MEDGTDEFDRMRLSVGSTPIAYIGDAFNTEFWTNPFQWGQTSGPAPEPITEGQIFPSGTPVV